MYDFLSFAIPAVIVGGFVRFVLLKKVPVSTPSLAAVMAAGIFLFASLPQITWLAPYSKGLTAVLFATWFWIVGSIVWTVINGTFYEKHFSHPIKMFAVGTWVAGTSVLANVVGKYFMDIAPLLTILAVLNGILWLGYIVMCIRSYKKILTSNLKSAAHGVLLLATVSTQSIVLLFNNVFKEMMTIRIDAGMILLGIGFYILGFVLIIRRYGFSKNWSIEDDWMNTNCILHGAISITGLAAAFTGSLPVVFTWILWLWIFVWFIIVELIEIYRAMKRVKKYGVAQGIFHYDVTQWSRNFTFGMFYAFTVAFHYHGLAPLVHLRGIVGHYGYWLVFFFLALETVIFFVANLDFSWQTKGKKAKGKVMIY
jgi:hypothetical protein